MLEPGLGAYADMVSVARRRITNSQDHRHPEERKRVMVVLASEARGRLAGGDDAGAGRVAMALLDALLSPVVSSTVSAVRSETHGGRRGGDAW